MTHSFPTRRSSDLRESRSISQRSAALLRSRLRLYRHRRLSSGLARNVPQHGDRSRRNANGDGGADGDVPVPTSPDRHREWHSIARSEEHTSELQSLMRNSYAVFCLKKKKTK